MNNRKKVFIHKNDDGKLYMPDSEVLIQEEYRPAIDDVISFFEGLNNKNILSIYLRGSLVFGLGIKHLSDIDFFIITSTSLNDIERNIIKEKMDELNNKYPFIIKFDLGFFTLEQMLAGKENVLLKLTAICIYGKDFKNNVTNPRPGKDTALSLSYLEKAIEKSRIESTAGLHNEINTAAIAWMMKCIVRSGFELVSAREGCFTRDLELCFEKFSEYYPDKKQDMSQALALALNPTNNIAPIARVYKTLGSWLIAEGKTLGLIALNCSEINNALVEMVTSYFGNDRIICLLRYGPKTKVDGNQPSDYDYLLLLNKRQDRDTLLLKALKELDVPIEIFIDYKDEIISRGIANYQRGRHGSYFFKILASADVVYGNNFYAENQYKLKIKQHLFCKSEVPRNYRTLKTKDCPAGYKSDQSATHHSFP